MVFKIEDTQRFDWPLLQNGAVNLYWRIKPYKAAMFSLEKLGYRIIKLHFNSGSQFKNDVSLALKWEQQFGYFPWNGNLDALNDGFRDEPFNSAKDSAFCIENFQACVKYDETLSNVLLDILERTSRDYLLFGKRLITLIQTTDPRYNCDKIGGTSAHWNRAEWLNSSRGL